MMKLAERMIGTLSRTIGSAEFLDASRTEAKWFTRTRMLSFTSCVLMLLMQMTTSLRNEIGEYFLHTLGRVESVTPQAFCQARRRIKCSAFVILFALTRQGILSSRAIRRFHGYRIFAIDGSHAQLPASEELRLVYPPFNAATPKSTHARMSVLCDVLDGFILDGLIESSHRDERGLAMEHIEQYRSFAQPRDILLMDRGYPSFDLLCVLDSLPGKYLLRVSSNFLSVHEAAGSDDHWISRRRKKRVLRFRVVRITLDTGEIETLITNLPNTSLSTRLFMSRRTREPSSRMRFMRLSAFAPTTRSCHTRISKKSFVPRAKSSRVLHFRIDCPCPNAPYSRGAKGLFGWMGVKDGII